MKTNLICCNCKSENTDYFLDFGFCGCYECGHSWGGKLVGKDLNRARLELAWIQFSGTEDEIRHAFRIAFDHLEAIAKALERNPTLKQEPSVRYATKLPTDSLWWIENRDNIENRLLAIEAPQELPR